VSREIGIGVVGGGYVAGLHVAALASVPSVRVAGVVDVDAARAEALARAAGARWTTRLDELLSWPDIDACVVCTPNDTHAEIGRAIASAEKHLLMEKPLTIDVAAAAALVDDFKRRELVLMPAHTHRFYDYGRAVKSTIDGGSVGRPVYVRLAVLGGWVWTDWRGWVLNPERSGGHVFHNGVHLLDLATWWIDDDPISVYAQGRKETSGDLAIYDYLNLVVRYRGGGTAVCEISRANRPRSFSYREVFVQGTTSAVSLPWDGEQGLAFLEHGTTLLPAHAQIGFNRQAAAWIAAIRGEAAVAIAGADALRSVAMACAGEQSLRTGRPVMLRDVGYQIKHDEEVERVGER
jgi:predicted dehydrogenase